MKGQKNIGLWASPRSCSTLLARSFEQRADCVIYDEPFYAPFLTEKGFNHPTRKALLQTYETDYRKVIRALEKPFEQGVKFSFQKHIAKNILPGFGKAWFPENNIFLLREPHKIAVSIQKIIPELVTKDDIGMQNLFNIFQYISSAKSTPSLMIHSNDLLKNPTLVLQKICSTLHIPFSNSMLSWKSGLEDSNLLFAGELLPFAHIWYGEIKNSTGFKPYEERNKDTPKELLPAVKANLPYYQKLLPFCVDFSKPAKVEQKSHYD